ncbi:MAG: LptF/LptG family permease [Gemmataceae bacterium]
MFKQIDWMLLLAYFKAYTIFLVSLLTLYIIIDLFTHLDDFVTQNSRGLAAVVKRIVLYYGYRLPQLFDRLCEAIALLAAMFTVVMMQAHNEHLPLLSAGVPTRRIIAPVLFSACLMLLLAVVNQEVIIPRVAEKLSLERNDPDGVRELTVRGAYEPNLIHIEGDRGSRATRTVRAFRVLIPETIGGNLIHITAQTAKYVPGDEPQHGRWEMFGCHPRDLDAIPGVLDVNDGGRYVLHTRQVDFEALTRDPRWHNLASTHRVYRELQRPESVRLASLAVLFHTRLTRPLLGAVLIFMGLSMILRDQTRNIVISSGQCIILCGTFFATVHACKMLGDSEILTPTLAAWLPILLFAPFAVVQFDAIQT